LNYLTQSIVLRQRHQFKAVTGVELQAADVCVLFVNQHTISNIP